jgi:hypothetical protein
LRDKEKERKEIKRKRKREREIRVMGNGIEEHCKELEIERF